MSGKLRKGISQFLNNNNVTLMGLDNLVPILASKSKYTSKFVEIERLRAFVSKYLEVHCKFYLF